MGTLKYFYCPYAAEIFLNQLVNFIQGGPKDAFQIKKTKNVDANKQTGDGKKMAKRDPKKPKTSSTSEKKGKSQEWRKKIKKLYGQEPPALTKKVKKVAKKKISNEPKKTPIKPLSQKEIDRRTLLTSTSANELEAAIKKVEKTLNNFKKQVAFFDAMDSKIEDFKDKIEFFNKIVGNFKNNIKECKTHTQVLKQGAKAVEFLKVDLKSIYGLFDTQNAILEHHLQITSNVEETLVQVLLAIRQNEYLQAWHPQSVQDKAASHPHLPYQWAEERKQRIPKLPLDDLYL